MLGAALSATDKVEMIDTKAQCKHSSVELLAKRYNNSQHAHSREFPAIQFTLQR
jgi:hypothetical protein